MISPTVQYHGKACNERRGFGRILQFAALICVVLGACIADSSGPKMLAPDATHDAAETAPVQGLEFVAAAPSSVDLQGAATIGPWKCRSTRIRGRVVLNADERALTDLFDRIQGAAPGNALGDSSPPLALAMAATATADISVPVMSLHGDSSGMDRDMQTALMAAQHPVIEFHFESLHQASVLRNPRTHQAELKLVIAGKLDMAGVARDIDMDAIVERDSSQHFAVHAQSNLLMSNFGVTPPEALFGLIKSGNQVQVNFDLNLVLHRTPARKQ